MTMPSVSKELSVSGVYIRLYFRRLLCTLVSLYTTLLLHASLCYSMIDERELQDNLRTLYPGALLIVISRASTPTNPP